MKQKLLLIGAGLSFCVFIASSFYLNNLIKDKQIKPASIDVRAIWTDPETHCQYFIKECGLQPRLDAGGLPICRALPVGVQ